MKQLLPTFMFQDGVDTKVRKFAHENTALIFQEGMLPMEEGSYMEVQELRGEDASILLGPLQNEPVRISPVDVEEGRSLTARRARRNTAST